MNNATTRLFITRLLCGLLIAALPACGEPTATTDTSANKPAADRTTADTLARARRPQEAPIDIKQTANEPGRLVISVVSSVPLRIAQAKVWAVDGAEVLDVAPAIADLADGDGFTLDPTQPLSVTVDYRLDGIRGRIVVALSTDDQPNSRRVVQSFTVGAPLVPTGDAATSDDNPATKTRSTSNPVPERFHRLPAVRK